MSDDRETAPVDPLVRNRRRRILLVSTIALVVLAFATLSNYGFLTRFRLERHKISISDSLFSLQHLRDSLVEASKKLRSDTVEIERIAREKYGMSKARGTGLYHTR